MLKIGDFSRLGQVLGRLLGYRASYPKYCGDRVERNS
jgi:hypothetical protein